MPQWPWLLNLLNLDLSSVTFPSLFHSKIWSRCVWIMCVNLIMLAPGMPKNFISKAMDSLRMSIVWIQERELHYPRTQIELVIELTCLIFDICQIFDKISYQNYWKIFYIIFLNTSSNFHSQLAIIWDINLHEQCHSCRWMYWRMAMRQMYMVTQQFLSWKGK
jgi:hypothetical protein